MGISERVKIFLTYKKMDSSSLADVLGISEPGARNYIDDGRIPKTEILAKFGKAFPNLDLNWIITGRGEMLRDLSVQEVLEIQKEKEEKSTSVKEQLTYANRLMNSLQGSAAIRERMQNIISECKIEIKTLSEKTNIPETQVNLQIYGKKPIAIDLVRELSRLVPEISYLWILNGNLDVQEEKLENYHLLTFLKEESKEVATLKEEVGKLKERNAWLEEQLRTRKK